MSDLFLMGAAVVGLSASAAWVCWVTASVVEAGRRKREQEFFRAVRERSENFRDDGPANYAAQFLAEAARRRAEERAAKLKEAAE